MKFLIVKGDELADMYTDTDEVVFFCIPLCPKGGGGGIGWEKVYLCIQGEELIFSGSLGRSALGRLAQLVRASC